MQSFENYKNISENLKGGVIAVGNFDGVHRGHQAVLRRARELARQAGKPFGVLTFEPHPKRLFRPDEPPARITPPDLKAWRLAESGVDVLFSVPFTWDFASQSAEEFIKHVLQDGIGAAQVVVGSDFRFGQLRKGDPALIESSGIKVTLVDPQKDETGEILSSSRVREALRQGDLAAANAVLGWEWEMRGVVVKGDRRGRELGYPTANFALGDTIHPAYGIYAARVQVEGERDWRGAAVNIGIRPMFEVPAAQVESYIFDFAREIYGQTLRVRPVGRLRSEARFDSVDDLIRQMDKDCAQARLILD